MTNRIPHVFADDSDMVDGKHASEIGGGGGAWTLDGTISVSKVASTTYNLSSTYDLVKIVVHRIRNHGAATETLSVYFNGDTTSSYGVHNNDGTTSGNVADIDLMNANPGWPFAGSILINADSGAKGLNLRNNLSMANQSYQIGGWYNAGGAVSLSSFTIQNEGANMSLDAHVYGMNF